MKGAFWDINGSYFLLVNVNTSEISHIMFNHWGFVCIEKYYTVTYILRFFCELCNVSATSQDQLDGHMNGQRHMKAQRLQAKKTSTTSTG